MAILTATDLRSVSNIQLSSEAQARTINKGFLNESFARTNPSAVTVFLSHSHTDREYIDYAVKLLRAVGVTVYVDWQDVTMPTITSAETAAKLKERIRVCKKFVLLASPAAIKSNWVNWEIGFGDSVKFPRNMAILPFLPDNAPAGWPEAEYLQIYPYIDKEVIRPNSQYNAASITTYYVNFPDKTRIKLEAWLKS